jgi:tRNA threonylcarbamoyladenosine modification (KEOPS) complex  Pcc1 subunit
VKKSEPWVASIEITEGKSASLIASLACEEVECQQVSENTLAIKIQGKSASDLRAKYNSTMRSLRAASEILEIIGD